jgi:hypothetical protein
MKGTLLGFSADSGEGAIIGDDGTRYRFMSDAWKAPDRPTPGLHLDFMVTVDGLASEIYPLPSANGKTIIISTDQARASLEGFARTPEVARVVTIIRRPLVAIALVTLFACMFLPYLTAPIGDFALISIGDAIGKALHTIDATLATMSGIGGMFGMSQSPAAASGATFMHTAQSELPFGYLAYLTPILACALIFLDFKERPDRRVSLGFAASGVLSFLLVWIGCSQAESTISQAAGAAGMGGGALPVIAPGFGAWIILLCSLGAFALLFNLIKLPRR